MEHLTAAYYDALEGATEHPDDPKPISTDAIRARKRAVREGRLTAVARDELDIPDEPVEEGLLFIHPVVEENGKLSSKITRGDTLVMDVTTEIPDDATADDVMNNHMHSVEMAYNDVSAEASR